MRAALAVLAVLLGSAAASAQDEPRYDLLRSLLRFNGVVDVLEGLPDRNERTGDLVLVLIGRQSLSADPMIDLAARTLGEGGAVLVANDDEAVVMFTVPGVRGDPWKFVFEAAPVSCQVPDTCLNRVPTMPFLIPQQVLELDLAFARQLGRIATNAPARLTIDGATNKLAKFPPKSRDAANVNAQDAPGVVVLGAAQGVPGAGVFASDPDLFSNALMVAHDPATKQLATDNFAFAFYVTRHLVNVNGPQKRTRCLFVENGKVKTDFDTIKLEAAPQGPPVPMPPWRQLWELQPKMTEVGNQKLAEFQDNDGPTNALLGRDRERFVPVLRVLLIAAAVAGTFWLVRAGWRTRFVPERLPAADPDPIVDDALVAQRRHALMRADNLYEPVRDHLRHLFAGWGAPPAPRAVELADGRVGFEMPGITMDDGEPADNKLMLRIMELYAVAHGPVPQRVTVARWKEIERMIDQVSRAAEFGLWRFAPLAGGRR